MGVKQIQFWASIAFAVMAAGFSAAMYLNRYALAEDLDKVSDKVQDHSSRMSAVESQAKDIESDYHSVREQLWQIADRVGAVRVPSPHGDNK